MDQSFSVFTGLARRLVNRSMRPTRIMRSMNASNHTMRHEPCVIPLMGSMTNASSGLSHSPFFVRSILLLVVAVVLGTLSGCATDSPLAGNRPNFDAPSNKEDSDERRRAKIRLELAVNYFQSKQSKIALDEVNNALNADNNFAEAHILKGLILMEAQQNTAADASFKQALSLAPNDADANNTYGWFLCQTRREAESFAFFTKSAATPFYATPAKPLQNAGICAGQQKNNALAESYLLRALDQDPGSLSIAFQLAQLYLRMQDGARASVHSRRILTSMKPTAETLWLGIRAAHMSNDQVLKTQLVDVLKKEFIASSQWAAYSRGNFEELQ